MAALYLLFLAIFLMGASLSSAEVHAETSRYRTVEANSTLLKLLLDPNRDESMRSEIFDMLHSRDPPVPAFSDSDFPQNILDPRIPQSPDQQIEQLQGSDATVKKDFFPATWRSGLGRNRPTFQGAVTGLMLGLTCIIVLLAYVGLVAYRRYIMIKTGNKHELLRNEEYTTETRIDV